MSSQQNSYVIVGMKFAYDEFNEEQHEIFEPYEDSAFKGVTHHNGLCVLDDGMNGEYTIIGRVLAKSDDGQGFSDVLDVSTALSPQLHDEVLGLLTQHFGIEEPEVSVLVLTHFR